MNSSCPICSQEVEIELYRDGCPYFRCRGCNFLFHRPHEREPSHQYNAEYWANERKGAIRRETEDAVCRALELIYLSRIPVTSILDFGCGKGLTVESLRKLLPSIMDIRGVDPFGEFKPTKYLHLKNLADLRERYPKDYFDAVFSIEVFEHLSDPVKALREIEYFLKPGGTILINTATWEFLQQYDPMLTYLDPLHRGHISIYSLDTFLFIGKQLGFEVSTMAARKYAVLMVKPGNARTPPLEENLATLRTLGGWFCLMFQEYMRLIFVEEEFEGRSHWAKKLNEEVSALQEINHSLMRKLKQAGLSDL